LIYAPILCYLDWKYRDIGTHKLWLPLLAVNVPVVAACYLTGVYPTLLLPITLAAGVVWILCVFTPILHKKGADALWLAFISIFAVINPISHSVLLMPFLMYLVGFTAVTYWAIVLDNHMNRHIWSFKMNNGVPFLIPISCAFVTALVVG